MTMTSISLLALLVVLGGLRLQLTNAAPGFADSRQELDMRDEAGSDSGGKTTLSGEEKMGLILQKLEQDGSVQFTSNGLIVQVTRDDAYGGNVSQDDQKLSLDKRGPLTGSIYTISLKKHATGSTMDIKVKSFQELMQIARDILKSS